MPAPSRRLNRAAAACALWAALVFPTLAQAGAAQEPPRPPRPPENVTVLTELNGQALREEMRRISTALGVKCDHCHVQGNFASDEKRPKKVALRMLEMTRGLNSQFFASYAVKDGDSLLGRVSCYTCHQGALAPKGPPTDAKP